MFRLKRMIQQPQPLTQEIQVVTLVPVEHAVPVTVPSGLPQGPNQFLTLHLNAFPDVKATVEDLLADGDKVVTLVSYHGTHQGAFRSISPTGKPITLMGINIFRIVNGKMVEHWGLADRLSALQQLGVVPTP